ncbi:MAG: GNAT family N-acetyltransferase, partial [Gammaproteobacteria bacterium]|nr:GNAT family N-acetyltransferase [Gammaproteobacteria bacterium]
MPIQTLSHLADYDSSRWDALLGEHPQPFLRHAFLSSLEDSGSVDARRGWRAQHQVLSDDQRGAIAALPLYSKTNSSGEYVFDWAWADACHRAGIEYYPKLLCAVPFSPVTGARLLGVREAAGQLLDQLTAGLAEGGYSSLHVNFTEPDADAIFQGRDGWLERIGCQFHWHNRGYRDFQDFLDGLTSRKRKQLRKEREQVAGQGIEFEWREG